MEQIQIHHPRISVIIPAVNEQYFIEKALRSVRDQQYPNIETIVVLNGSTDETEKRAKRLADTVIVFSKLLGYSGARNQGAVTATGDVFVFMDADSYMAPGTLSLMAKAAYAEPVFGTVLGGPDEKKIVYLVFFAIKNLAHILGLYKGVLGGVMFCNAGLFRALKGYDESKEVDENFEFSRRARSLGGRYILLTKAKAFTSMRRFEKYGLFRMFIFWVAVRFLSIFGWERKLFEMYSLKF